MRIAVVGTGVAGLTAAWLLRQQNDVWVYEKNDYVGGHAHTAMMTFGQRQIPVDTAFVIFNTDTYPIFSRLLDHLGVESREAPTSFSCNVDDSGIGYFYGRGRFLVRRSDWFKPALYRMVIDTLRFFRRTSALRSNGRCEGGLTIETFLEREGYSRHFIDNVLLPQASALWSLPLAACRELDARAFVAGFREARFLSIGNRHHWRTVAGGSREYIRRLISRLQNRIRLRTGVCAISRQADAVRVRDSSGAEDFFDHVILASHADQSLQMLTDASEGERAILGRFTYYPNKVVLHHDPGLMPGLAAHWATWNYFGGDGADANRPVAHTYWMNRLQGIDERLPTFVSLNPLRCPQEHLVERTLRYDHPTLDAATVQAQGELALIQGKNRTWFCGSCYERGGSHEDALRTGLQVARSFGVDLPW
jgi:predicted NAD/FAD-binding protein